MQNTKIIHGDFTELEQRIFTEYGSTSKSTPPNTGRLLGTKADFAVIDDYDLNNSASLFDYAHGRQHINWHRMSKRKRKLYDKAEDKHWKRINGN